MTFGGAIAGAELGVAVTTGGAGGGVGCVLTAGATVGAEVVSADFTSTGSTGVAIG